MVEQLFPKLSEAATIVGVGSVGQLEKVAQVFDAIERQDYQRRRVIAIRDGDAATRRGGRASDAPNVLRWDRYHIESYLLEEKYVSKALKRLTRDPKSQRITDVDVLRQLKEVARELVDDFARERVEMDLRDGIRQSSRLSGTAKEAPAGEDVSGLLAQRISEIARSVCDYHVEFGQEGSIRERLFSERRELESTLEGDEWKKCFKGKDVIGRFVGRFANGIGRDTFITAIVREMQNDEYQPPGMCEVFGAAGLANESGLGKESSDMHEERPSRRRLRRFFER